MDLVLQKRPKNPTVIIGFPGFGLVGAITVEFLNTHLETEKIGKIIAKETAAMIAVHKGKLIDPISIYYNKKYNVVLVQGVSMPHGLEWMVAQKITDLCMQINAKEIICLEGVGSQKIKGDPKSFFISSSIETKKTLLLNGCQELMEGIIIGLTAALLSQSKEKTLCLFSEAASELPDSKAAAALIKTLDKYLGLSVDYKPLLMQAQQFEEKLKDIVSSSQQAQERNEKRSLNYVG